MARTARPRQRDSGLDDLRARVRRGERVLVSAIASGGAVVGGTARALYLPGDVVLAWHEIDEAVWNGDAQRFDIATLGIEGPARTYQVVLAEPGRLPELVRERVTATIVVNQHVPVSGKRGFRVVARRVPDTDELAWVAVYDPGIDANDPDVRDRVAGAVQVLRRDLGI